MKPQAREPTTPPNMPTTSAERMPSFGAAGISPTEPLAKIGIKRTYGPDQQIYEQDAENICAYRLISGLACSVKILADGRRQIVRFLNPGDYFGFEDGAWRRLGVEAISAVTVVRYSKQQIAELAETDRAFSWHLAEIASEELVKAYDRVVLLGRRTATEKVAWFLLQMARPSDQGRSIEIGMSRTDIADYLGLTTETVCRAFSYFCELGAIRLTDPHRLYLLDPDLLDAHAEGLTKTPPSLGMPKRSGMAMMRQYSCAVPS